MPEKLYADKKWLTEQYVDKRLSAYAIAEKAGCSNGTVYAWLRKHGIATRSLSEAFSLSDCQRRRADAMDGSDTGADAVYRSPDWLKQKYWDEGKSTYEMAQEASCRAGTLLYWMDRLDIPRRSLEEAFAMPAVQQARREKWAEIGEEVCQLSHRPEARRKQSRAMRRAWKEGAFDDRDTSYAETGAFKEACRQSTQRRWQDPEYRQWRSDMCHQHWEDGVYDECQQVKSERTRQLWRDGIYDGCFQSPTSIEVAVSDFLDANDIDHISQYRPPNYARVFDEFIPPNVLIEIQGTFWHADPRTYDGKNLFAAQQRNVKRDAEKKAWAEENGFRLIVLWEADIVSGDIRYA